MNKGITINPIIIVDDLKGFINNIYEPDCSTIAKELNRLARDTSNTKSKLMLQGVAGTAVIVGLGYLVFTASKKIDSLEERISELENAKDPIKDDFDLEFDDDADYKEVE